MITNILTKKINNKYLPIIYYKIQINLKQIMNDGNKYVHAKIGRQKIR